MKELIYIDINTSLKILHFTILTGQYGIASAQLLYRTVPTTFYF